MAIFVRDVNEFLSVVEAARTNIHVVDTIDVLVLTELLDSNQKHLDIIEQLFVVETSGINKDVDLNVSESLTIVEDNAPRVFNLDISEILAIDEGGSNDNITENLTFIETATGEENKRIAEVLTIVEVVSFKQTYNLNISEILSIIDGASGYALDICIPGAQVNTHSVIYTHTPLSGPIVTLTLPSPDFDNMEKFEWNRVNAKTRGGDLIVFRDPIWPKAQTLVYKWAFLKKEQRDLAIVFLRRTLGKLLTLTDYEGRTFNGVIRNPDAEFAETTRDSSSVSIQFEIQ